MKLSVRNLLVKYLADQYTVFFISFEGLGGTAFETEVEFCKTICELLYDAIRYDEVPQIDEAVKAIIKENIEQNKIEDMMSLSATLSEICKNSVAPVVLIIDEVDQASNYKVFIDFLGMLRSKFLKRNTRPTFHSVILAGVYKEFEAQNPRRPRTSDEQSMEYRSRLFGGYEFYGGRNRRYAERI